MCVYTHCTWNKCRFDVLYISVLCVCDLNLIHPKSTDTITSYARKRERIATNIEEKLQTSRKFSLFR